MVKASVTFRGNGEAVGLVFRHAGAGVSESGYAVVLDAQAGEVSLVKLSGFKPIQKRRWPVKQGGEHSIRVVAVENLTDVYIDDMRALNGSCPDIPSGGVSLLAKGGSPLFRGIEYRLDAE